MMYCLSLIGRYRGMLVMAILLGIGIVWFGSTTKKSSEPEVTMEQLHALGYRTHVEPVHKHEVPDVNDKLSAMAQTTLDYHWHKGGFGTVFLADFTIKNASPYTIEDFKISCDSIGASGTSLDNNTQTIYQIVLANHSKTIHKFDMGFINSQVTAAECKIVDLVVLPN